MFKIKQQLPSKRNTKTIYNSNLDLKLSNSSRNTNTTKWNWKQNKANDTIEKKVLKIKARLRLQFKGWHVANNTICLISFRGHAASLLISTFLGKLIWTFISKFINQEFVYYFCCSDANSCFSRRPRCSAFLK